MPKPNVSHERIPQILEAAAHIFAQKGLHQATMDEVAQQAKLSKAAVYLYFKSKEELVLALLQTSLDPGYGGLARILERDEPIKAQLLAWVEGQAQQIEREKLYLGVSYEFYALAVRQAEVRAFFQGYFVQYRALLTAVLNRGVERGEFRPGDMEPVAVALLALFEGVNLLWLTEPENGRWAAVCVASYQLLLDALTVKHQSYG